MKNTEFESNKTMRNRRKLSKRKNKNDKKQKLKYETKLSLFF